MAQMTIQEGNISAPPAAEASPDTYKVLMENEHVRVRAIIVESMTSTH
ncbi:MAG: hypothetical protein MI892_07685 [Desulfobacterales bacterium]|nr:hypothetical protein [Desulfobacterales bacterium]